MRRDDETAVPASDEVRDTIMSERVKIGFDGIEAPTAGVLVVPVARGAALPELAARLDAKSAKHLSRAMKAGDFHGRSETALDILVPPKLGLERVLLVGMGDAARYQDADWVALGGRIAAALEARKIKRAQLAIEARGKSRKAQRDAAGHAAAIALGAILRAYRFRKYRSKAKARRKEDGLRELTILCHEPSAAERAFEGRHALAQGVMLARDLVNEPANRLGPVEFAAEAQRLEKLGVGVEVLDEHAMRELKMDALLAVAQGSERPPRLVVMRWLGAKSKRAKPLVVVGKGVCFDTGGISLKPAKGMEDMKGDMGGAAAVTGLMHTLAARKARANVVGVIGLVENMPGAAAQRPGDIVTAMSGTTIEVLNTDAEGRLVLADALWYAKDRFKPKAMIDLATLTGAILVALGQEHAGLFSNNDRLARQIAAAGEGTGEKVWRMPMGKAYDKMIESKVADIKNIGGRWAGAITAAQFLARFVDDVPWAHLDIAGTAMASPKSDINASWASGYGVRLLDTLVAKHYES